MMKTKTSQNLGIPKMASLLLAFFMMLAVAHGQSTITGRVTDKGGAGLPVVNVLVKGTTAGVLTDGEGKYSITVPSNINQAVLLFSFVGFNNKEEEVAGRNVINVILEEEVNRLDEVVVMGYIQQKKSNITSSVKNISGDVLTKDIVAPSVPNMLQGKMAGVQVINEGGSPGSMPTIRIRGKSSIGSSVDPLWVVDGIVYSGTTTNTSSSSREVTPSVPNINPNDVESISVLKDAAATSLYGSRASNGVIIVTTKRAKSGTSNFDFSARIGAGTIQNGKFKLKNSSQIATDWAVMGIDVPDVAKTVDYNWWKEGTQMSLTHDYNASFYGGTEKLRAFISGGYYKEDGVVKGKDIERFRFTSNVDFQVNKWLKIKPRLIASQSFDQDFASPDMYTLSTYLPFDNPYYSDGTIVNPQNLRAGYKWYGRDESNYMYDAQWNYSNKKTTNVQAGFDFDVRLTDWLSFASTNNYTMETWKFFDYGDPRSESAGGIQGQMTDERETWVSRFSNQMFRFNKTIDDWTINALLAYEFNDYDRDYTKGVKEGFFPNSEIHSNAAIIRSLGGMKAGWAMDSYLSNVNVAYGSRYFGQLSFRNDGSSRLAKNNRRGSFFSISGGWNITQEDFMKSSPLAVWVNDLKLRMSYGGVGNLPTAYYPYLTTYDVTIPYAGVSAAYPYQLGNSNLSWEKSYETNIGIDARLWDRVSLTMDYYIKNTSGLVYLVSLPVVGGYPNQWQNIGAIVNRGTEITVGVEILKDSPLKWDMDLNWSLNRNKINELYGGKDIISGYQIRRVGQDINSFYMRKWAGVDPANGDPLWEKIDTQGQVSTTNNYNDATLQIAGRSTPNFTGGFSSNMSYKEFTLNMNWNFVVGNDIYNYDREMYDSDGAYPTFNQIQLIKRWSRWEKPGDIATHPRMVNSGNKLSQKTSSRYMENGSYLRLRNISLGYKVPNHLVNRISAKAATVTFGIDNLITFTKYSGRDPEVGETGVAAGRFPNITKFVLGLNLNF